MELLIGKDVPEAQAPCEVRSRRGYGPYTTKTKLGWTLNGPLGRHRSLGNRLVNPVRADEELGQKFHQFMSMEFSESGSDP